MSAPALARASLAPERSWVSRAAGRLRHGLLLQEILDRLARLGLVICPYFVTVEDIARAGELPQTSGLVLRRLEEADEAAIARLGAGGLTATATRERLREGRAFGAFVEGALVACTWARFSHVPIPFSGSRPALMLGPCDAYLYGMRVAPLHRGSRLAPLLRGFALQELAREGRTRCYSVTLAFNRSARRFKARCGAREAELRLYLHLRVARLPGLDLRLRIWPPGLATPRAMTVAHVERRGGLPQ